MKEIKFIPVLINLSVASLMFSCQDDDMDVSHEEQTKVEI
jgi:hypothetical protein